MPLLRREATWTRGRACFSPATLAIVGGGTLLTSWPQALSFLSNWAISRGSRARCNRSSRSALSVAIFRASSAERRFGASELDLLALQGNLAATYRRVGRAEQALCLKRDVYSGRLRLNGEEHEQTLVAANNYAGSLIDLQKYEEAMSLLRRTMPVARRVTGDTSDISIRMRKIYADALYEDPGATLVDLREAVTTLEDTARIARRVFGGAHPLTRQTEQALQQARAALRAREASA